MHTNVFACCVASGQISKRAVRVVTWRLEKEAVQGTPRRALHHISGLSQNRTVRPAVSAWTRVVVFAASDVLQALRQDDAVDHVNDAVAGGDIRAGDRGVVDAHRTVADGDRDAVSADGLC